MQSGALVEIEDIVFIRLEFNFHSKLLLHQHFPYHNHPTTPLIFPDFMQHLDRRFCVAPMMDWTDRYCRHFHRLLSKRTVLYTEMVTTGALLYGDRKRHLRFDSSEHPIALQLGGSAPRELATSAKFGAAAGYDEINLNCGCPSERVQSGQFGAALMKQASLVADSIKAMQDSVSIPVTVKHRTGVDDTDSYQELVDFIGAVAATGCRVFIVHARKAWLKGLSPKQNREIPPLQYERVYRLKQDFPDLEIIINGGVTSIEDAQHHLQQVDGVMVGREAYQNPYLLAAVDSVIYGDNTPPPCRIKTLELFAEFVETELQAGTKLSHMTRHVLGLFSGMPGARNFRRHISENAHDSGAGLEVLYDALAHVKKH